MPNAACEQKTASEKWKLGSNKKRHRMNYEWIGEIIKKKSYPKNPKDKILSKKSYPKNRKRRKTTRFFALIPVSA